MTITFAFLVWHFYFLGFGYFVFSGSTISFSLVRPPCFLGISAVPILLQGYFICFLVFVFCCPPSRSHHSNPPRALQTPAVFADSVFVVVFFFFSFFLFFFFSFFLFFFFFCPSPTPPHPVLTPHPSSPKHPYHTTATPGTL